MLIRILLVAAVLALAGVLFRHARAVRVSALVKLGMAAFLIFAGYAVLRPDHVSVVASWLGVGRGTDLVLYLLVVGVGFFAARTYVRFRDLELRYARLARRIALDEARNRELGRGGAAGPPEDR